ncbi:MAG: 3-oxoadipate enol-lactone hydrolase [marine bacterium B5-7]|nr:MAG: 3-oxoadipate enol-lactone hydrolase [marine bacterium B5-7]
MSDLRVGSMVTEDNGEGAAVVMVHGLGGTSNSFQSLMPVLSGYRVLRPDLPGAGRSAYRPGIASMDGLAICLTECLQAAGIGKAHFVAHSMGTLVCQYLAARSPDIVASLVLFGPMLEPPAAARTGLKDRAEAARRDGMAGIADAVSSGSVSAASRTANPVTQTFVRESLMRQDPAGYASHCQILGEALAADHSAIQCPTLLVAGENDPVTPVDMASALSSRITDSRLVVIPAIGHWMMIEAVDTSAELLRGHLDGITS